ncbi:hypothetical protein AMTR_s00119p00041570 [Amborella trichopoda]|uniref:Gibberellic acid methyltransferase n=2 Tax=Amborella trichopoda TaxID=13333 RepID=W1NQ15_AMBTC|nr:hypothetical protein AMTR_s00119p00041570 [Amborella trichopoda]QRX38991.1 gibberellic acid methyltransferase [Amborella trichopoda]
MVPVGCMEKQRKNRKRGGSDLHSVLCMQGGDDDGSYAKNSEAPASAIALAEPLLVDALLNAMTAIKTGDMSIESSDTAVVRIADLGCATGLNTLATVDLIVRTLQQRRRFCSGMEFEAFFADLPSNDFNSLFRLLPPLSLSDSEDADADEDGRRYYAAGVAGSFYGRLFPKRSIHVAVSLSALHWLSQIPKRVLQKSSGAWNKGRAWIDGAEADVVAAYARQSEEDLLAFLRCRREEMVEGGLLFLLMAGRDGSQGAENQLGDPESRAKHPFTSSMDEAWRDLLNEGLIDEEMRDTFNIPAYMRSIEEVRRAFDECGGFEVKRAEYERIIEHSREKQEQWIRSPVSYGKAKANLVRATLKPIIEAHIGPALSEEFFNRFEKRVSEDIGMLHKTCFYGVIVVVAIKK